jgi:hypothetical protein
VPRALAEEVELRQFLVEQLARQPVDDHDHDARLDEAAGIVTKT